MSSSSGILQTIREDDFIEYFLFPLLNNINDTNENELNNLLIKINKIINDFSVNYIWHKDNFHLTPRFLNSNLLIEAENGESNIGKFF